MFNKKKALKSIIEAAYSIKQETHVHSSDSITNTVYNIKYCDKGYKYITVRTKEKKS